MTEIERIKQEGWLSEGFWKAEMICDYYVSEEMKKVWAILLDLYREFSRVCEKYNLQYWADGGTMLGTVRHKGFIPWDDDMDLIMPRKDYDKLLTLADEFKHPYFFQTPFTDKEYGFSFIKIRNSNTATFGGKFIHTNFNKGIFIDVFPLDKTSKEDIVPRKDEINELVMSNSCRMKMTYPNLTEDDREKIKKYYRQNLTNIDVFRKVNEIASSDEEMEVDYVSDMVMTMYSHEKTLWEKSIYDNTVKMPFECFEINVPGGYDLYLKTLYGNYMEFPPKEKRGIWHDVLFFPEIPYKEYYKQRKMELTRTITVMEEGVII